jgi:SAM-dependent methyltransferase
MTPTASSAQPILVAHTDTTPSAWVTRWAHLIRPEGQVLDVACGSGRHAHWLAGQWFGVTAVDRDALALDRVRTDWPTNAHAPTRILQADLEHHDWPLANQHFDAVVVTNYLWRPLWPHLLSALATGGVYLHETFALGQASVGKPSRPDFLLRQGELLSACQGLRIVAYEDGFDPTHGRYVQRIAAVRETAFDPTHPPRYPLRG